MELRHLRYMIAVAEELNFSKAAKRLYVAQPAISRQIADLEKEVGTLLFVRTRHRVMLTEAGKSFVEAARDILRQADAAMEKARRTGRGEVGELMIAFLGAPTMLFLPQLIKRYRDRFPEVVVRLFEMTPSAQLQAFEAGQIHMGFTRPLPSEGHLGLDTLTVFEEPLLAVVPERHPLAKEKMIPLAMLTGEPWVLLEREQAVGLQDQILAACWDSGFSPFMVASPTLMATVLTLVAAEQGVSVVPISSRNLREHGVVYLEIEPSLKPTQLIMTWKRDPLLPTCDALLALLQESHQQIKDFFLLPAVSV